MTTTGVGGTDLVAEVHILYHIVQLARGYSAHILGLLSSGPSTHLWDLIHLTRDGPGVFHPFFDRRIVLSMIAFAGSSASTSTPTYGTDDVTKIDDEIRVHEGIGQTMTRTAPSIVIGAYHPTEGIGKKVMKKAKEENGEGRIRQRPIVVETMTAEGVGLER